MRRSSAAIAAVLTLAAGAAYAAQQPPAPVVTVADEALSAAEARAIADELAGILEEGYVFPDVARRYAAALRGNAARGDYDAAGGTFALAERLTADLRAVSPDNHLRVAPGAPPPPGERRMIRREGASGEAPSRPLAPPQPVEQARWLAPGIAFVRFNVFPGSPEAVAAAERFMVEHAEAETIIFDIRTHMGGGLAEMDAVFPYLFAAPTRLVAMETRASVDRTRGSPTGELASLRRVPGSEDVVRRDHFATPHPTETRLQGAKVYVLTSSMTASAAEHFALSLKRTGRATLIGQPTAGAGHYGGLRPLAGRFAVFVPVGRTYDPDTGRGWEGDGVAPHVEVPAEQALVEALVRSGVARPEAERLSAEVHPARPMNRPRPRA